MKLNGGRLVFGAAKLRLVSGRNDYCGCCQHYSRFVFETKCAGVAYTRGSPF